MENELNSSILNELNFNIKNASITLFKKENDTFTLDTFNRSLIPRYLETYI